MKLSKLLERLEYEVVQGSVETEVTTLANDSRKVESGSVFVCISGAVFDGHQYVSDVAKKGAAAIIAERDIEAPKGVTVIKAENTRYALALMSAAYFGYPAEKLKVIGITGTKGKTTTTYLIRSILEGVGHKVGLIGTIEAIIGDRKIPAANTTPESFTIQQYFAQMVEEGCDSVVMEVSSQGLMLHRTAGIPFEIGEDSRQMVGRSYDLVILNQKPAFRIQTAARRLSCQEDVISGDNFYIGNLKNGQALLMIADGMGNGVQAAKDSEALLSAVEELVMTGFEQEMAVRLVNAYLAEKNKGEHFTTLDMLLLDLYTGVGHLVKYGAATTYVCRGNWMECIKSTSLPVGVMEDAGCECSSKKYYAGDLIVMVSDGVLDSILFENKDDYMHTLLEALKDEEPETVVEAVIQDIRSVCGKRLKDDATIIVCKVMKNL